MPLEPQLVAFGEEAAVLGTMDVGIMWDRARGEFLDAWVRFNREGLQGAELDRAMQAFMGGLSDKPLQDLARKTVSVAYNQGRAAEIISQNVPLVVRSEVLDSNTCDACRDLDGAVVEVGTEEFDRLLPPAQCFGGDRCRGFYIPITEEFL